MVPSFSGKESKRIGGGCDAAPQPEPPPSPVADLLPYDLEINIKNARNQHSKNRFWLNIIISKLLMSRTWRDLSGSSLQQAEEIMRAR
jgi:hypothetical protein